MKKQEIIKLIIAEEKQLWDAMMDCIDILGLKDPITDIAIARWTVVNNLLCSILNIGI